MDNYLSVSPPDGKPASLHDSARGSPEPFNGFEELVRDINVILGPSNGIDSASVDVEELKCALSRYQSCKADWERYAFADHTRGYTRNLVDNCNGKSNLVSLICCISVLVAVKCLADLGFAAHSRLDAR